MGRIHSASELKLALRLVVKQPLLAITIVLALGAGIGIATAGFTFMDAVVNGRLPFDRADAFVRTRGYSQEDGSRTGIGQDRFSALRDGAASFEYLGAIAGGRVNILHPTGEVESVSGARVTPGWFRYLPYRPLRGRTLTAEDGRVGAAPVTLISERLWRRHYAERADVLGSTINVAGTERTIVGILPEGAGFPNAPDLWMPLPERRPLDPAVGGVAGATVAGVLVEGVDIASADLQVGQLTSAFNSSAAAGEPVRLDVRGFTDPGSFEIEAALTLALGVLILVMLLVATNVGVLIHARASARQSELAVRSALGASRSRLVVQLFVEVLVLGSIAAVLGLAASQGILAAIDGAIEELPFWIRFEPDLATTAFVVVAAVLTAAVGGALPAFRATRRDLARQLHTSGRAGAVGGLSRSGRVVVIAEVALSVALVSGAGVLGWAVADANRDRGLFERATVLTAKVNLDLPGNPDAAIADSAARLRGAIRSRIRELPAVRRVGAGSSLTGLHPMPERTLVEGRDGESVREVNAARVGIDRGALEILDARPLAGRLFDRRDFAEGAEPVAVVNEVFARSHFGGAPALGRRIAVPPAGSNPDGQPEWHTIVGITPDLGVIRKGHRDGAGYFVPMGGESFFSIAVEARGDPLRLVQPVRKAVFDLDPDVVVRSFSLLENAADEDRGGMVAMSAVLLAVGAAALLLSLVGIYAILSFSVASRTREIGIRMALGAGHVQVLRSVVGRSAIQLAVGGAIGSVAAVALNALMRVGLVYEVPNVGPVVIPSVVLLMVGAGVAASWVPARRALSVRPVEAIARQ